MYVDQSAEGDMLKWLYMKLMVRLWMNKAWPEVMGSLLASTETDVPESIFPMQGLRPVPSFPQVCWTLQIPQRARGRGWG